MLQPQCRYVREEFSAFLDNELDPETRDTVEAHLANCADCLRELHGYKRVDDLYALLAPVAAPAGLEGQIHRALRPRRFARPQVYSGLAAAAATVLVLGGLLFYWPEHSVRMEMASAPDAEALPETVASMEAAPASEALSSVATARKVRADDEWEELPTQAMSGPAGGQGYLPADDAAAPEAKQAEQDLVPPPLLAAPAPSAAPAPETQMDEYQQQEMGEPETQQRFQQSMASPVAEQAEEKPESVSPETMADEQVAALQRTTPAAAPPPPPGAPAAASAPARTRAEAKEESAPSTRARENTRPMNAKGAVAGAVADADAAADSRTVAGRAFSLRDEVWVQAGYVEQPLEKLRTGSVAWEALVKKEAALAEIAEAFPKAVFVVEEQWYRLGPDAQSE